MDGLGVSIPVCILRKKIKFAIMKCTVQCRLNNLIGKIFLHVRALRPFYSARNKNYLNDLMLFEDILVPRLVNGKNFLFAKSDFKNKETSVMQKLYLG